jgi:hypothetical protein
MFMVNTYRWDYPLVAALAAPRPLLICNSDKDTIFPLDGVIRLHSKVAKIYQLYGAQKNLGLLITEGPHEDTQDLQLPVFRWFNRFLKGEDPKIEMAAVPFFTKEQLKVFDQLPAAERTSHIHDSFVPMASIEPPATEKEWAAQRDKMRHLLQTKSFAGWPENPEPVAPKLVESITADGKILMVFEFQSQEGIPLKFYALSKEGETPSAGIAEILNEEGWNGFANSAPAAFRKPLEGGNGAAKPDQNDFWNLPPGKLKLFIAPRGAGPTALPSDASKRTQVRRRYMLLGQTLDGMRVWDIKRAIEAALKSAPVSLDSMELRASGTMAANLLYAGIFMGNFGALQLRDLPASHMQGPDYLNVLRFMDIPQAIALALQYGNVELIHSPEETAKFARQLEKILPYSLRRI